MPRTHLVIIIINSAKFHRQVCNVNIFYSVHWTLTVDNTQIYNIKLQTHHEKPVFLGSVIIELAKKKKKIPQ